VQCSEAKTRAQAVFRTVTPQERTTAMAEFKAEQQAVSENMAPLRALRLAREGEASQPKTPRRNRGTV
jgi:hypothetical protein